MLIHPTKPRTGWLIWRLASLIFLSALLIVLCGLVACGGSSPKMLYVVGLGTPSVAMVRVPGSGALSGATFVSTGGTPTAVVVDPQKKFAFTSNSAGPVAAGGVSQYTVGGNGVLAINTTTVSTTTGQTTTNTGPVPAGVDPVAMVMDSKGRFVFVANQVSNSISVYSIDRTTGLLAEVKGSDAAHSSPFPTDAGPSGLAISGNLLFVANQAAGDVSVFTVDLNTGVLAAAGAPVSTGLTRPASLDVDASGKFLYVADAAANAVVGFNITASSGQLSPRSDAPVATGTTPVNLRVHKSANFVYVANSDSGDVSVYSVASSGALSPVSGSPFKAGTNPSYIATDSSGKFLFVANQGSNDVSVFGIGSNGGLQPVSGSPFLANVVGHPVGLFSIN